MVAESLRFDTGLEDRRDPRGVQVESWVDEDGRILRASSALGFTMEKTEYELARQAQEDASGLASLAIDEDVILSTAIRSNVDLGTVEEHEVLRFPPDRGWSFRGFQLEGGRQTLSGDTLTVRRENWDALDPGFSLPYKLMDFRETLEAQPLIQKRRSTDPRTKPRRTVGRWSRNPKEGGGAASRPGWIACSPRV